MKKTKVLKKKNYYFWDMYMFLNNVHFKKKSVFLSQKNGKKYTLHFKKKTSVQRLFSGLLWLAPALFLIYLVATLQIHFTTAIMLVIIYHFVAMWALIRFSPMWIKEK